MNVVDLTPEHHWVCPHCVHTDVTREAKPHSRFHQCRGKALMTMPMVPDGIRCKTELREREDYVGAEKVQTDAEGRPWMSTVTTRDDGTDCAVFAPTAFGNAKDYL